MGRCPKGDPAAWSFRIPRPLVDATLLGCGGTLQAARLALRDGAACSIGGGFHHAHSGHGEGFCILHDVAIALARLLHDEHNRTGDGD